MKSRLRRTVAAGVALVVLVVACAALTVVRRGWWATGEVAYRGVHPGVERVGAIEYRRFRDVGKVEVPDPGWRPLRVTLALAPAPGAPQSRSLAVLAIDDRPVHRAVVGPGPTEVSFEVRTSPSGTGMLGLQIQSETFDEAGRGVAAASARVEPEVGPWPVLRHALPGAALGALLWWAWLWPRRDHGDGRHGEAGLTAGSRQRAPFTEVTAFGVLAAALFVAWAVLKPPLQAPDESQHLVRTLAAPNLPWLSRVSRVPVSGDACNPWLDIPWPLSKLPFHPDARLSLADVKALQGVDWPRPPGQLRIHTQAWAYPPVFHDAAALIGGPLTTLTGASPYESTYVYRLSVAALATACWAWVMAALGQLPLSRGQRWLVAGLCLANPMVPFLASSLNPDAVHVPLMVLGLVYGYVVLLEGRRRRALFVVLLLAAWTKSSGVLTMATLGAMAGLLVAGRHVPWRHAVDRLRPVLAAGIVAHLTTSMWAPLTLYGQQREFGLGQYWDYLVTYGWRRWVSFWGMPGWLDYQAPDGFYLALAWVLAANGLLALPWLRRDWRRAGPASFLAIASLVFIAGAMASEFLYLIRAGLNFQGRYLLPAMVGVAALALHRWRSVRLALLGTLIALHLALAHRSVTRYYDAAATWCASLPWIGAWCEGDPADGPAPSPLPGLPACSVAGR